MRQGDDEEHERGERKMSEKERGRDATCLPCLPLPPPPLSPHFPVKVLLLLRVGWGGGRWG